MLKMAQYLSDRLRSRSAGELEIRANGKRPCCLSDFASLSEFPLLYLFQT